MLMNRNHTEDHNKISCWKSNRGQAPSADEYIDKNRALEITIHFAALYIIHAAVIIFFEDRVN